MGNPNNFREGGEGVLWKLSKPDEARDYWQQALEKDDHSDQLEDKIKQGLVE